MRPERLSNPEHPAQKPVRILKKIIEIASNEGDIIFDPFMGVGSTGVASLELNRRFIGVELDAAYFQAARSRINDILYSMSVNQKMTQTYPLRRSSSAAPGVHEPMGIYQPSLFELDDLDEFFQPEPTTQAPIFPKNSSAIADDAETGSKVLPPIIKWPGGKEKELKYIFKYLPDFERFFEPFVGGGSVFMAMDSKHYFINDLSTELIKLYTYISESDEDFFGFAENIDTAWERALAFFQSHPELSKLYFDYRNNILSKEELKISIKEFCKLNSSSIAGIINHFSDIPSILVKEVETNLFRKMTRMKTLEMQKHILPDKDVEDNIETAIKSALYMNFRYLYNHPEIKKNPPLHTALFLFIRNYAYSGMFRYSSKGDFNVPYGGIAYNGKLLKKKLDYYRSAPLLRHFKETTIYNRDFHDFLIEARPTENDFIFLDPPYDTEFSTYARNEFNRHDQERLADYLINHCRAKWMLIIKNTEFIYNLYTREGISIQSFDKHYAVSFMNRNERNVTHLLITNYPC